MNKKYKIKLYKLAKGFIFFFSFVIVPVIYAILMTAIHVTYHEDVHKIIYEDYGCNATIKYSFLRTSGETQATCILSEEVRQRMNDSQNINEIVGYNFSILLTICSTIACLIYLIFLFNIFKNTQSFRIGMN